MSSSGDPFNIEEIYMYTGELGEKNKIYATSGGIIDGVSLVISH